MPGTSVALAIGWCEVDEKLKFSSRKLARQSARRYPGTRKSVYPCNDQVGMWHVGELASKVRQGYTTRSEFYGRVA